MRTRAKYTSLKKFKFFSVSVACFFFTALVLVSDSFAISSATFIPDTAIEPFYVSRQYGDSTGQHVCNNSGSTSYTQRIYTGINASRFNAGTDYLLAIPFFMPSNNNALDSKIPVQWRSSLDNYIWIKEVEIIQSTSSESTLYMIIHSDAVAPSELLNFVSQDYIIMQDGECVGNYGWFVRIQWAGNKNYDQQLANLYSVLSGIGSSMPSQQTINSINSAMSDLNDKADDINDNLEGLRGAQEQANEDAQDRWESDKQEESDREDSANDQSEDAQSLFNFSVINPFGNLFNLFNDNCTASIPTLANWLNLSSSSVRSWWCDSVNTNIFSVGSFSVNPSTIRSVLTPVFSIASVMLLFGFVVRWLSGNSGDIYGARNMNKELNG